MLLSADLAHIESAAVVVPYDAVILFAVIWVGSCRGCTPDVMQLSRPSGAAL